MALPLTKIIGRTIDFLRNRKRAYQLSFGSPAGNIVLIDLAKFCRAAEVCYAPDERRAWMLEGRREVWLRIQQHMHLSSEELFELYRGNTILHGDEDNG